MILEKNIEDFELLKDIMVKMASNLSDKFGLFKYILSKIQDHTDSDDVFFLLLCENKFSCSAYKFNGSNILNYKKINYKEMGYKDIDELSKDKPIFKLINLEGISYYPTSDDTLEFAKDLEYLFDVQTKNCSYMPISKALDKKVVLLLNKTNTTDRFDDYEEYLRLALLFLITIFDINFLPGVDSEDAINSEDTAKDHKLSINSGIIGESKPFKNLLSLVERIAKTDATVLITGESGTGKELIAKHIYNNSPRKSGPFVALNCAAIPADLLENELFGHKKGAYTDATSDYIGKFGMANGGTLFLDEIGELSSHLQAKLLRVLQYKVYEPIGSMKSDKSDVRIIAATNRNLSVGVKEGTFREDLFYRLNVVPVEVPPLRDRKNDIEMLAKYFLKVYNTKHNRSIRGFTPGLLKFMKNYNWPGNVRELENFVQRAVVVSQDEYIAESEFEILDKNKATELISMRTDSRSAVTYFKREFVEKSLINNDWNQTKTAKELKIQRTYLSRLIKELNINKI